MVAHRGASGYRPEHTLEAYRLAIDLGADFIEPDLVITADGALVARHEAELSTSTDVSQRPEFADRRRTKALDGTEVTGWFVEDFTLDEIKTLWARERLVDIRQQSSMYDDRFRIPTFAEITALAAEATRRLGRPIGVYPEMKHPTHFATHGLWHDNAILRDVAAAGLDTSQLFIQCFEPSALHRLSTRTSAPLVQLVNLNGRPYDWEHHGHGRTFADLLTPAGLQEVSRYASAIGVHKSLVIPRDPDGRLARSNGLVAHAHDAGLAVHAWTFRNENAFLPSEHRRGAQAAMFGDAFAEYAAYFNAGVDGVFTDHPDTAITARNEFAALVPAH
ncbi:glycerophosphodiester phosphodiesterase [Phytoactinopolyspora halotolerans]|uniref:glycerophosphodiester phosphodiesterase n=1 Tax=Phytoactinopolyspora halotolerans TaxID=1981512 RepID=A0A6L9S4F8_9ACTN|nr:glycerophosphodiester phosphodiesterase [Phytoactinopolyspora halotolerans]NED99660.1 glycerophosphodiester phosphodiesterase [Phytoactinopolyspora halotolerans]